MWQEPREEQGGALRCGLRYRPLETGGLQGSDTGEGGSVIARKPGLKAGPHSQAADWGHREGPQTQAREWGRRAGAQGRTTEVGQPPPILSCHRPDPARARVVSGKWKNCQAGPTGRAAQVSPNSDPAREDEAGVQMC